MKGRRRAERGGRFILTRTSNPLFFYSLEMYLVTNALKIAPRACYCALLNPNTDTCFSLGILLQWTRLKSNIIYDSVPLRARVTIVSCVQSDVTVVKFIVVGL